MKIININCIHIKQQRIYTILFLTCSDLLGRTIQQDKYRCKVVWNLKKRLWRTAQLSGRRRPSFPRRRRTHQRRWPEHVVSRPWCSTLFLIFRLMQIIQPYVALIRNSRNRNCLHWHNWPEFFQDFKTHCGDQLSSTAELYLQLITKKKKKQKYWRDNWKKIKYKGAKMREREREMIMRTWEKMNEWKVNMCDKKLVGLTDRNDGDEYARGLEESEERDKKANQKILYMFLFITKINNGALWEWALIITYLKRWQRSLFN